MKIFKSRDVKTPERGTYKSAGLDFFVPNDSPQIFLNPGTSVNISSGIYAKVPRGHTLVAFNKSGVALRKGLQVGACIIDEDYQGEIHLHVTNISNYPCTLDAGEKLVQFLCIPVKYVPVKVCTSRLDLYRGKKSSRNTGSFGSTDNT